MQNTTERKDVYSRITAQIVQHLEKGVRPRIRPWNAEHAAGRITRPLRFHARIMTLRKAFRQRCWKAWKAPRVRIIIVGEQSRSGSVGRV
jgi:hypothetical protein